MYIILMHLRVSSRQILLSRAPPINLHGIHLDLCVHLGSSPKIVHVHYIGHSSPFLDTKIVLRPNTARSRSSIGLVRTQAIRNQNIRLRYLDVEVMVHEVHALAAILVDLVLAIHVALCEVWIDGIEWTFKEVVELVEKKRHSLLVGAIVCPSQKGFWTSQESPYR